MTRMNTNKGMPCPLGPNCLEGAMYHTSKQMYDRCANYAKGNTSNARSRAINVFNKMTSGNKKQAAQSTIMEEISSSQTTQNVNTPYQLQEEIMSKEEEKDIIKNDPDSLIEHYNVPTPEEVKELQDRFEIMYQKKPQESDYSSGYGYEWDEWNDDPYEDYRYDLESWNKRKNEYIRTRYPAYNRPGTYFLENHNISGHNDKPSPDEIKEAENYFSKIIKEPKREEYGTELDYDGYDPFTGEYDESNGYYDYAEDYDKWKKQKHSFIKSIYPSYK